MPDQSKVCLYCQQDHDTVPLIHLSYKDQEFWICPQHLPILIHQPSKLGGLIPDADKLNPSATHDH